LLSALVAGFTAIPSTAHGADQETAPCAKLTAREVRFSAGDSSRVVFVTATDFEQNGVLITGCVRDADTYVQEWQVTGFIGRNGFAPVGTLREGQYRSPTGSFSATEALGLANPGTKLNYHVVNPRSRWGGPGSPFYNNYVEGGLPADENLWYWAKQGTYAQAAVVNYNRLPDSIPVPGADYAIFFGAGNRVSAGCVSTTLETSTQVVKTLVPGDRFIMGVVSDVFVPASPSIAVPPPTAPATQNIPSATASEAQSAPTAGTNGSDLIPLGILLVAGGATAVFVFFALRKQENSRRP
jgi:L,D-peptidoglycan transpeptidase YkuD (ErfK/YbiS/YcfS/YnhG family)